MKKIFFLSALFFLIASFANAEDDLCERSRACKKACNLKMAGKFDDLNPDHQTLIAQCGLDLTASGN